MKQMITRILPILFLTLSLYSCNETKTDGKAPQQKVETAQSAIDSLMQKKIWTADDYEYVLYNLEFKSQQNQYPSLKNSSGSLLFSKMVDESNFEVPLSDTLEGIKYKYDLAARFFDITDKLISLYSIVDQENHFHYDTEIAEILAFTARYWVYNFRINNEQIKEQTDDPNSAEVKNQLLANANTCVGNFMIYLQFFNNESSFGDKALETFVLGIRTEFPLLIKEFPNADYKELKKAAVVMKNKAVNPELKIALKELINSI